MKTADRWLFTCDFCGTRVNAYEEHPRPEGWLEISIDLYSNGVRDFHICDYCRVLLKKEEARIQKEELLNPVDDPNGALNGQGGT